VPAWATDGGEDADMAATRPTAANMLTKRDFLVVVTSHLD
jgi:hypothetical protein